LRIHILCQYVTRTLFLGAVLLVSALVHAQEKSPGNPPRAPYIPLTTTSIYAELGGNTSTVSINGDHNVLQRQGIVCVIRTGLGIYLPDTGSYPHLKSIIVPLVPVMVQAMLLDGEHHIELGGGILLQLRTLQSENYFPPLSHTAIKGTFLLGYRYQPHAAGIMFRAGFTPVWYNDGVYWGAGLSAGWGW
jgi:hypothetical protein